MTAVIVAAARMAPLALVAPWAAGLGGVGLIARLLVALGLSTLAAALVPAIGATSSPSLPLLAGEALVGGLLGLVAAVPFRAAQAAGALVDVARTDGRARGPLGDALLLLALALFAALDGPRLVVGAAVESYVALPPGALDDGAAKQTAALAAIVAAGARIIALGVALAAPVLAALVVAELVGGLTARIASRRVAERGPALDVARQLVALAVLASAALAIARGLAGGDAGVRGLPALVGDVAKLLGGVVGGGVR